MRDRLDVMSFSGESTHLNNPDLIVPQWCPRNGNKCVHRKRFRMFRHAEHHDMNIHFNSEELEFTRKLPILNQHDQHQFLQDLSES